jgi:O-antigen/teichoic acid export membrane protein
MHGVYNLVQQFTKKKQLKETFWAYVSKGIFFVSGLFFLYIIPNQLGVEKFGEFTLIQSYISLLQIFFGTIFFGGAKKEITENKFNDKSLSYFVQLLKLCCFSIIISSILFLVIVEIIDVPLLAEYRYLFLAFMFVNVLWCLMKFLFEHTHRIFFVAVMYLVEYLTKILLLLVSILFNFLTLRNLLLIFITGYALAALTGFIIATRQFKNWSLDLLFKQNKPIMQKIIKRVTFYGLSTISVMLLGKVDTIILSFFLPMNILGYYSIASELARKAVEAAIPITTGVVPLLATSRNAYGLIKQAIKRLLTLNLFVILGFIIFGRFFITRMYGPEYELSIIILYILSPISLILSLKIIFMNFLVLKDDAKAVLFINIAGSVLNLILTVIFILAFGVYGAAIATILAYSIWLGLSWWRANWLKNSVSS